MIQQKWHELHADKRHQPRYPSNDLVSFVFRNFKSGDKILDLGCGAGRHVKFLVENGFKAFGVDYSENGIKATQELLKTYNLQADLKVSSVDDIPYEDESFDGLLCYGVLYYNSKEVIEKAAKEIYRVLKKDGVAYIVVRSIKDYRYLNNEKISKYEVFVNENDISKSAFKENGMKMYFFDKDEVKRVFSNFRQIEINSIKISYTDDSFADENFVVILRK
ncbi:class I SAM-dependent methyltransferase [Campylobacter jejuni]|nr:class I SAM-dependent methyltransferase [Campylobacter jejuni]EAL8577402.1 class I SAM-dependent methyltransferase [Campylobacter jejuni]EID8610944.1 class I SAM-dependent methyltransferase [Campylobacter jejuni]ELX2320405.1 class I SAM-dependent methyltransferase [Campylobacter jejuni]